MDISASHVSVPEFLPNIILYIYISPCSLVNVPCFQIQRHQKTIQQKLALNAVKPMKSPIFLRSNVNSHNFFSDPKSPKNHNKPIQTNLPGFHQATTKSLVSPSARTKRLARAWRSSRKRWPCRLAFATTGWGSIQWL